MIIIVALLSGVAGFALTFLIFYFRNKVYNVSKVDYECQNLKLIELTAQFKIIENSHKVKDEEREKLAVKVQAYEDAIIRLQSENSALNAGNRLISDNSNEIKAEMQKVKEDITSLSEQNSKLHSENGILAANNGALEEKLNAQKDEIKSLHDAAILNFENIANRIMEEKSGKFTEVNKTNIEDILKPLRESISEFKTKVEETYDKESKERYSLENSVKQLVEQTNKVSTEANNLTSALKGQSKKQGDWGEMILESILQSTGLEKDRQYILQESFRDEDGNILRPDVVVRLPDDKSVVIDSKVSLTAYDRYSSATDVDDEKRNLSEHIKSIKRHIDGLSSKNYEDVTRSLDFKIMFIPIEPAYLLAVQGDSELWEYAYVKKILLVSPTNLIACLKLINDLWIKDRQSKNAREIVKRGERLLEKLAGFVESFEKIGASIKKADNAYSEALGQLRDGRGSLITQAMQLKELGLNPKKALPGSMLPIDYGQDQPSSESAEEYAVPHNEPHEAGT